MKKKTQKATPEVDPVVPEVAPPSADSKTARFAEVYNSDVTGGAFNSQIGRAQAKSPPKSAKAATLLAKAATLLAKSGKKESPYQMRMREIAEAFAAKVVHPEPDYTAEEVLRLAEGALNILMEARSVSTIPEWELRRKMCGEPDHDPITKLVGRIQVYFAKKS